MKKITSLILVVSLILMLLPFHSEAKPTIKTNNETTEIIDDEQTQNHDQNNKKWREMSKSEKQDKIFEVAQDVGFVLLIVGLIYLPIIHLNDPTAGNSK